MDLVNIIYKYVNRFINSNELVELLENINKDNFLKKEIEDIKSLLENVKKIINNVPNEIDEIEINRINTINHMLELFKNNLTNENMDPDIKKHLENNYNSLLKAKEKIKDCGERYNKIFETLTANTTYIKYCQKMDSSELLEFITQYLSVPLPPNITQETFDDLVKAGIKNDEREKLWRLALNYKERDKDFSMIEDYFILKRDDYYLAELISAVKEDLNIDKIFNKINNTKDKNFINNFIKRVTDINLFSEKELAKLKAEIKKGRRK